MTVNMRDQEAGLLKKALLANATFSGLCGLLILLAPGLVLGWLGVSPIGIWPVGAMLLGFSLYLLWMSRNPAVDGTAVKSVIWSDWAWVAGTAVLLLLKAEWFSTRGMFLLLDIALVVGLFAFLQGRGLKRVTTA